MNDQTDNNDSRVSRVGKFLTRAGKRAISHATRAKSDLARSLRTRQRRDGRAAIRSALVEMDDPCMPMFGV